MSYKVNQKIYYIQINNAAKERSYRPNGVVIEELKIIGVSRVKICLNNEWFTTLDVVQEGRRKDRTIYSYTDDVKTSVRTRNDILDDGVFISLYSTKKPTKKTLEKMVASASNTIDKDFGFLFKGAKDELYNLIDEFKIN